MPNLGAPELIIILVIVALLFGASRVTDLAGALGKSVREFRQGMEGKDDTPQPSAPPVQAPPPAPVAQSSAPTRSELLANLRKLRDAGVITEDEFQAKQAQLQDQA